MGSPCQDASPCSLHVVCWAPSIAHLYPLMGRVTYRDKTARSETLSTFPSSDNLGLSALPHVDNYPGFSATWFQRTFTDLSRRYSMKAFHTPWVISTPIQHDRALLAVGKELCNFPDGTHNCSISGVLRYTPCRAPQPYSRCSLRPCVRKAHMLPSLSATRQSK
jgi:hypothetical protein